MSVQILRLTDANRARQLVPPAMRVVQILPGWTIAGVYCARYERGSSLSYSELAVAAALVANRSRIGFWISHIYVDDPLSIAGGREIWNLPKRFAQFAWGRNGNAVSVTEGSLTLCRMTWEACSPRLRLPVVAPVLVQSPAGVRWFWTKGSCRLARCRAGITAHRDSPVARLDLTRSRHALAAGDLTLTIPPPG